MRFFLTIAFLLVTRSILLAADLPQPEARWYLNDGNERNLIRSVDAIDGEIGADYLFCQTTYTGQAVRYRSRLVNNWPGKNDAGNVLSIFSKDTTSASGCTCLENWSYIGVTQSKQYVEQIGNYKAFPRFHSCEGDPVKITELPSARADCKPVYEPGQIPAINGGRYLTTRCDVPISNIVGSYRLCFENRAINQSNGATGEIGNATLITNEDFYKKSQLNETGGSPLAGYSLLSPSCFDIWNQTAVPTFLSIGIINLGANDTFEPIKSVDFTLYKIGE